jgi:hypothetical protein
LNLMDLSRFAPSANNIGQDEEARLEQDRRAGDQQQAANQDGQAAPSKTEAPATTGVWRACMIALAAARGFDAFVGPGILIDSHVRSPVPWPPLPGPAR